MRIARAWGSAGSPFNRLGITYLAICSLLPRDAAHGLGSLLVSPFAASRCDVRIFLQTSVHKFFVSPYGIWRADTHSPVRRLRGGFANWGIAQGRQEARLTGAAVSGFGHSPEASGAIDYPGAASRPNLAAGHVRRF